MVLILPIKQDSFVSNIIVLTPLYSVEYKKTSPKFFVAMSKSTVYNPLPLLSIDVLEEHETKETVANIIKIVICFLFILINNFKKTNYF